LPILPILACTVLAALLTGALTPLAIRLSLHWGIVARPDERRKHRGSIPRLGGLAVGSGFLLVGLALTLLFPLQNPADRLRVWGVLTGCMWMIGFGWLDDAYELNWGWQLFGQTVAAGIAIATTIIIERFTHPLSHQIVKLPWAVFIPLTWFWVAGMINTVNFLDGLDGLAVGVSAIAATLFGVHMLQLGQSQLALYAFALMGACLGFLRWNFAPARIFLGGGALVLGYLLATLSILAPARAATALMVMALPIADTAWQMFTRWRAGKPIFHGDRGHLHFRLQDMGYSTQKIVVGYWLISAILGILSVTLPNGLWKLLWLGGFLGVVAVGFWWLGQKR